jgi:hypothetical protein
VASDCLRCGYCDTRRRLAEGREQIFSSQSVGGAAISPLLESKGIRQIVEARDSESQAFVWREYRKWRPRILRLLSDLLTKEVFEDIAQNPPRYFVDDNLGWIDAAVGRQVGETTPIRDVLDERFPKTFPYVRAFHGCKPASIESYRAEGIRLSNIEALKAQAYVLFGDSKRTRDVIEGFTQEEASYCAQNRGKIFFCLDSHLLLERASQYMVYGSEYLICLANRLGAGSLLRERGIATIIECDVPYSAIPESYRKGILGSILREVFARRFDRSSCGGALNCGFPISEAVPRERIVAFHFPKALRDPYRWTEPYHQK